MSDDTVTMRMRVHGSVQGVGFRAFAVAEANARSLDGWVRNRSDGTLEILISGPTKTIEEFVGICMRGPAGARVTNLEMGPADMLGTSGFSQRPTL